MNTDFHETSLLAPSFTRGSNCHPLERTGVSRRLLLTGDGEPKCHAEITHSALWNLELCVTPGHAVVYVSRHALKRGIYKEVGDGRLHSFWLGEFSVEQERDWDGAKLLEAAIACIVEGVSCSLRVRWRG